MFVCSHLSPATLILSIKNLYSMNYNVPEIVYSIKLFPKKVNKKIRAKVSIF